MQVPQVPQRSQAGSLHPESLYITEEVRHVNLKSFLVAYVHLSPAVLLSQAVMCVCVCVLGGANITTWEIPRTGEGPVWAEFVVAAVLVLPSKKHKF